MTVKINKPAINLREELASLRNQGGLPKEDKLYVETLENGDFSNGTTGWSSANAVISVSSGQLTVDDTANAGADSRAYQDIKTVKGRRYVLTFDKVSTTSTFYFGIGNSPAISDVFYDINGFGTSTGKHTHYFTAESELTRISMISGGTGVTVFDNVSVQEVGENLVTNGTFDYDGGWTLGTNASISGGTLSYSGGSGNVTSYQNIGLEANKTYHIAATVSGYVQGHLSFRAGGNTTDTPDINANGTYSFVFTVPSNGNNNFMIDASTTFVGSIDNIIVTEGSHQVIQSIPYGYDVKDVYIDGDLAREGEGYDYEVKTDGINQWIKPSVEPTATTETVVIGVRK
jgi:hypothetical protein